MRPHKWRVRCSRGTASARPSGRSSGARGTRSGGMRRTSRPPIPLPSGRLCTKPVRSESGKRRRRPAAPRGRCGSKCRHTTMWCAWPGILPPRDGGSARTAGTSSSGRTAKTTLRASPGNSPVTAALMRVRPSGSGGLIYIHPGVTVAPALVAAFLDPGCFRCASSPSSSKPWACRPWPCSASSTRPATRPRTSSAPQRSLLTCTRTPGSSSASQGSAQLPAPGCSPRSATTDPGSRMPKASRPTPAPPPSPAPPARPDPSPAAASRTTGSTPPATYGRSPR